MNNNIEKKMSSIQKFIQINSKKLSDMDISFSENEFCSMSFGWHRVGNVCVVYIPQILEHKKFEIAKIITLLDKSIKIVVQNKGIHGKYRKPMRKVIYPEVLKNKQSIETVHHENKCKFKMDVLNIMFSKGNLYEKKRISILGNNEVIVDMFAGIGYFSIPISVHSNPKSIYAIELNPQSYYYLCENIKLNSLENKIIPIYGDCRYKSPKYIADRIIMGYIENTDKYLKYGIECLKDSGGILHFHDLTLLKDYPLKQIAIIKKESMIKNKKAIIKNVRIIKKYSPTRVHVVIDAYIFKN